MAERNRWHTRRYPHRELNSGERGGDITQFQRGLNARLEHIPNGKPLKLRTDGVFGPATLEAWQKVRYWIGLPDDHAPTIKAQLNVRRPWTRSQVAVQRANVRQIKAKKRATGSGVEAIRAANRMVGKVETGYNDSAWLRQMEDDLPHDRIDWMIPGQPYCGLGCIWSWWEGAQELLPDGTVYTPNIDGGTAYGSQVAATDAQYGDLVVFHFGSGDAKHVGLARGPARGGVIPTVEFNTSPGNGGSQSNGGGVWKRTRPVGLVLKVVRPPFA